ncbi:hypothetical protein PHISCL_07397 [Aspergillus sclerotialis]|uniref:Uncharacterized protein n=1 Tax=Aspergillus sclerotialis TaxID=2070753 RepID=A0A3A2ZLP2_9EURO|nr:hypothetical protein PHISCL_07397 [Aspergillus sclerotialis]
MSTEPLLPGLSTKAVPGPAPDGMGTGLFASTDIQLGDDVLYIKTPFVAVLDTPRLEDTCAGCFGKRMSPEGALADIELKACTGCRVVRYCDKTCQSKDWRTAHSLECAIFQKLKPRILPNNARAVLRMVLRTERQKYKPQELDLFSQLETHIRDIREQNTKQWERISLSATAVKVYAGTGMEEEIIASFFAKLDLNSFNLVNALYDRIGLYMHPYAALINHSCEYNSVVGFDGDELHIKAIRPIKRGEQVFISYVDTTNPYQTRQIELAERYFFDCQCSKCMKGTDSREDSFLSPPQDLSKLDVVERQASETIDSASTRTPSEAIATLESAIHTLHQTTIWPTTRQPYISLRNELIASLLSAGRFNGAFIQAAIRYIYVDPVIFPQEIHPIRQLHAWALVKLAIHLSQGVEINTQDVSLERYELNFGLIIWSVLSGLVKNETQSCGVPTFRKMVRESFNDVYGQFRANGMDPESLGGLVKEEWEKLGGICRRTLGME